VREPKSSPSTATHVTYDLTINSLHTYYVEAGNTPVLVNNAGGCGPLDNGYKWPRNNGFEGPPVTVSLKSVLEDGEFRADGYRILEAASESTWCIKKQGKTWLVFYFERGTKFELQRFKEESAACEYFYNRIVHG
jgi:hypothetical protein